MPGRRPSHEHYMHGPRGDRTMVLPHKFVTVLASTGILTQLRSRVTGADPELDAVVVALMLAARETGSSDPGTVSAPTPEPAAELTQQLTTRAAAQRMHLTTRAVTRAIGDGRLKATKDAGGRWWITPDDLQKWKQAQ